MTPGYERECSRRERCVCPAGRPPFGFILFRISLRTGQALPLRRRSIVHYAPVFQRPFLTAHLLVQACQHVWLVKAHDVYQKFTYVGRLRSSLPPLRLHAGRFRSHHDSAYQFLGGYIVPRPSYRAVTGSACLGGERLMEQPISSGGKPSCETETQATYRSHKDVLGQIHTYCRNLHSGRPSCSSGR